MITYSRGLVLIIGALLSYPAVAAETWEDWICRYTEAPDGFPESIHFRLDKERRQVIERGHLPYQILHDNNYAVVAVSVLTGPSASRPLGPTGHFLGTVGDEVTVSELIWSETLMIDRQTGASAVQAVELGGRPFPAVRGICEVIS